MSRKSIDAQLRAGELSLSILITGLGLRTAGAGTCRSFSGLENDSAWTVAVKSGEQGELEVESVLVSERSEVRSSEV